MYSGSTQKQQRQKSMDSQDTLFALAADTGGKALIDNNELVLGITQAQEDLQSYYILGFYSSDEKKDGAFRRVDVKLTAEAQGRLQAKLDYRRGYFAEKEFKAFGSYDKERQLEDALMLGDPVTELRLALEVNWFRVGRDRYFVPVAVKIPGRHPAEEAGERGNDDVRFHRAGAGHEGRSDGSCAIASRSSCGTTRRGNWRRGA